jgi:diadenosine tetraphosphate (Ap4A) HIT family hydrolase
MPMRPCSGGCWHCQPPGKRNGSPDGFRVIINSGRIGQQEVQHLHAHIVGGPEPVGPMLKRI